MRYLLLIFAISYSITSFSQDVVNDAPFENVAVRDFVVDVFKQEYDNMIFCKLKKPMSEKYADSFLNEIDSFNFINVNEEHKMRLLSILSDKTIYNSIIPDKNGDDAEYFCHDIISKYDLSCHLRIRANKE